MRKRIIDYWALIFICSWKGHDLPHPADTFENGKLVEIPFYKCHTCGKYIPSDET